MTQQPELDERESNIGNEIGSNIQVEKVRRCAYCDTILSEGTQGAYCCPDHEELRRLYNKDYYIAHKDDLIKKSSSYIKDHPDVKKGINQRYYANLTPEQREERNRKRRLARNKPVTGENVSVIKIDTPKNIEMPKKIDAPKKKNRKLTKLPKVSAMEEEACLNVNDELLALPLEVMVIKEKNRMIQDAIRKSREAQDRNKGIVESSNVDGEQ
jgi:hypothetical protein